MSSRGQSWPSSASKAPKVNRAGAPARCTRRGSALNPETSVAHTAITRCSCVRTKRTACTYGRFRLAANVRADRVVPAILDGVVCTPGKRLGNFRPPVSVLRVRLDQQRIFRSAPRLRVDVRVQNVVPACATLPSLASRQHLRHAFHQRRMQTCARAAAEWGCGAVRCGNAAQYLRDAHPLFRSEFLDVCDDLRGTIETPTYAHSMRHVTSTHMHKMQRATSIQRSEVIRVHTTLSPAPLSASARLSCAHFRDGKKKVPYRLPLASTGP